MITIVIREEIKQKIIPIFEKCGIKYAGVFGSVARDEDTKDSDIDIVVSIDREIGIFEFLAIQYELEKVIGRKVDLISKQAINKYIKPHIEKELVNIYERS